MNGNKGRDGERGRDAEGDWKWTRRDCLTRGQIGRSKTEGDQGLRCVQVGSWADPRKVEQKSVISLNWEIVFANKNKEAICLVMILGIRDPHRAKV